MGVAAHHDVEGKKVISRAAELMPRAVLVIGVAVSVVGATDVAVAQKKQSQPGPVQDAPLEWWQQQGGLYGPAEKEALSLIQAAATVPASAFDPNLPSIPLDAWLFLTLAPRVSVPSSPFVDWRTTFCDDPRRAAPGPGPESCVEGTVHLTPDRDVHIIIGVADPVPNPRPGLNVWRRKTPGLRDVYIERVDGTSYRDSLDVPTLAALPDMLSTPFDRWPPADFDAAVSWTPRRPMPGDTVLFRFVVRNTGLRYVRRADVQIAITPRGGDEFRRDWFPHLGPGESTALEVSLPLPDGIAWASIDVTPSQIKPVRDASPNRHATIACVGCPP